MSGHQGVIVSVCFSPDSTRVVTGSSDKLAMIWDAKTGTKIGDSLKGHSDVILSVCYSPDGTQIITGSADSLAMIWDSKIIGKIGKI